MICTNLRNFQLQSAALIISLLNALKDTKNTLKHEVSDVQEELKVKVRVVTKTKYL